MQLSACRMDVARYTVPSLFLTGGVCMFTAADKSAVVYLAVNKVNGKRYVGVTGRSLAQRRYEHIRDALKGIGRGAFQHALRKYGVDGFEWVIVAEFETTTEAVAEEKRLIRETCPEYNSTYGGEGYAPRVWTDGARERIAAANRGNKYCLGKKHSEATKATLREIGLRNRARWLQRSHLGPAAKARRVVCLNDGRTYPSASAAARACGVAKSAIIEVCLRRPWRRTVGGMVFRYEGDHIGGAKEAHDELSRARKYSSSGYKGVSPYRSSANAPLRWRAQIIRGGRVARIKRHLGLFDTPQEAHAAYLAAAAEMG